MFDQFLLTVNQWMTAGSAFAMAGAFAWGMVSVLFSPCHLASIPLIVAYVGGQQTAVNPQEPPGMPAYSPWDFSSPSPSWVSRAPCWAACLAMWAPGGRCWWASLR